MSLVPASEKPEYGSEREVLEALVSGKCGLVAVAGMDDVLLRYAHARTRLLGLGELPRG